MCQLAERMDILRAATGSGGDMVEFLWAMMNKKNRETEARDIRSGV